MSDVVINAVCDCPFCGATPDVEGNDTKVAVHYCKADMGNLMVVRLDVWQQRAVEAVTDEAAHYSPLLKRLSLAGMGKAGTGNTLWDMVLEICDKYELCEDRNQLIADHLSSAGEIALELSVLNRSVQNAPGDMPAKSVLNFTAEVGRLTNALFDLVKVIRTGKEKDGVVK